MEAAAPIPATATGALIRQLKEQGINLHRHRDLAIKKVFYAGDGGGIMCDVTPQSLADSPIVVSLTHLRVSHKHPLGVSIRQYQKIRVERLSQANSFGATGTTLSPRR
ncbi:MAG: hypothetical protein R2911_38380 [Caldilineaceae bacterium]